MPPCRQVLLLPTLRDLLTTGTCQKMRFWPLNEVPRESRAGGDSYSDTGVAGGQAGPAVSFVGSTLKSLVL